MYALNVARDRITRGWSLVPTTNCATMKTVDLVASAALSYDREQRARMMRGWWGIDE